MLKETVFIDLKKEQDLNILEPAATSLKNGGLVIFPTETVYGVGANGLDREAVQKIFLAKGRNNDNPLILHISDLDMLEKIVKDIKPLERKLMAKFWPGPLTLILNKKNIVPDVVSANLSTVGVRMPNNQTALKLISLSGCPIAAPSANTSGKPSGTNIEDIREEFQGKVDYIVDNGDTEVGLESTVVMVIDDTVNILRPGKITKEDLLMVAENVVVDVNVLNKPKDGPVLSPGVKYRHYAPESSCILIYSKDETKLISKIKEEAKKYKNSLILTQEKHLKYFDNAISMGESLEEISHNMFKILRQVDKFKAEMIIIEGVEAVGLGLAIMNRLLRACSYNYIEI